MAPDTLRPVTAPDIGFGSQAARLTVISPTAIAFSASRCPHVVDINFSAFHFLNGGISFVNSRNSLYRPAEPIERALHVVSLRMM